MVKHNKMYKVYLDDITERMKEKGITRSYLNSKFHLSNSKINHMVNYPTL